jgi:hypothetical protein
MERQFTEFESQQFIEAVKVMRSRGLIVDDNDGKESVDHNAERILAFYDLNKTVAVSVQSVLDACEQMRDQMYWKSAAQIEYEKAYSVLTQSQKDAFGAWWFSPSTKKTIVINGEEGFSNAAKILQWMRGKSFSARNFDLAVSNLASSHGSLHWAPTPQRTDPRQHSGDTSFMKKSETNLTARDHAARRAADAAATSGKPAPTPTPDYKALAESITTGRTHSDSLRLQKMFVMKRDNPTEIDWEQTAYKRQRLADGKAR